jgi:hypothetical protein
MLSALILIQDSGSFRCIIYLDMETLPYPAIVVTHTFQVQAANEMARTCDVGMRISQMDLRSFITHQVVFVQPVLSSRALSAVNGEVTWRDGPRLDRQRRCGPCPLPG